MGGTRGSCNVPIPTMDRVRRYIMEVIGEQNISIEEVLGQRRFIRLVLVRRIVMTRLIDEGYSLHGVGIRMNRHHTTVLHDVRRHRLNVPLNRWNKEESDVSQTSR